MRQTLLDEPRRVLFFILFSFFFKDRSFVIQTGLQFLRLLPIRLMHRNYGYVPPYLAFVIYSSASSI